MDDYTWQQAVVVSVKALAIAWVAVSAIRAVMVRKITRKL